MLKVSWSFAVLAGLVCLTPHSVEAASVGLSIHFEAPPRDALMPPRISSDAARACLRRQALIDGLWDGERRTPVLKCRSRMDRPLIVTGDEKIRTIVRP